MNVQPGDMLVAGSANMKVRKVNSASSFALVDIIEGQVQKGEVVSQLGDRAIASDDEGDYGTSGVEEDFIDSDSDNNDDSSDETEYVDDNRMKKQTQDNTDNTTYAYSNSSQRRKFAVGLLTGLDFDILRLKFPNNSELSDILPRKSVVASGLGFNANIALDYDFMDILGLRVFTGWKRFSVKSKDSHKLYDSGFDIQKPKECYADEDINDGTAQRDCELRVDLYGVNIQLQYYIPGGIEILQPFVGLGGGIYFVINTGINYAIKEVKTMGSLAGILGVNVTVSKNMYLTAQADYNFSLSSSSTAQVHFIGMKIGLMYGL